jgi:hypothetical protein
MSNPLNLLQFPVSCRYAGCGEGPFTDGLQVAEHVTAVHLAEAVWTFAIEQMLHNPAKSYPAKKPEVSNR